MDLPDTLAKSHDLATKVATLFQKRAQVAQDAFAAELRRAWSAPAVAALLADPVSGARLGSDWYGYAVDAAQRSILFWDTMRERGNAFVEHNREGLPPVLHFDYEPVVDGRRLRKPVNYQLVRIVPPPGVAVDPGKRPYVIIDPRAGHGPGIGGFKDDSQVGVALRAGHPVYFVIFFRDPEPGQTLLDVCEAEKAFVRKVRELHPKSAKPAIVGNCQGGWAAMMLAASDADDTGPIVVNGAPMSYWGGAWTEGEGDNPMRYAGGLLGGSWLASLASDLGDGVFDGAHLVQNFENLNLANTFWDKYYHLYANVDTEPPRFLEFERWWGGFYLMNREEIEWITQNLFVGNRLWDGTTGAKGGKAFDLRDIRSPIVLFASMGDNITPPQQAFNWIADVYSSTEEIKANGQTIIGLVHDDVGHLGIFVAGHVVKKEHAQIVEVLKYIHQLPPGLYAMHIAEHADRDGEVTYDVTLKERKVEDLRRLGKNDRVDEKPFQAVAALSELGERAYSLLVRPFVQDLTPEWFAKALRDFHPLRVQYWAVSDKNPLLWPLPHLATMAKAGRRPRSPDNDHVRAESLLSDLIAAQLDLYRDLRDAASEAAFFHVYGNLLSLQMADEREEMRRKGKFDPRTIPAVREVLDTLDEGSAVEGLARIAMLIGKAGSGHRRLSQMRTTREILSPDGQIAHLSEDERRRLLQEETIVVEFEPERAKRSLPNLLRSTTERRRAHALLDWTEAQPGLEERQRRLAAELRALLPLAGARGAAAPAKRTAKRKPARARARA